MSIKSISPTFLTTYYYRETLNLQNQTHKTEQNEKIKNKNFSRSLAKALYVPKGANEISRATFAFFYFFCDFFVGIILGIFLKNLRKNLSIFLIKNSYYFI
jgi:hypothetical protein